MIRAILAVSFVLVASGAMAQHYGSGPGDVAAPPPPIQDLPIGGMYQPDQPVAAPDGKCHQGGMTFTRNEDGSCSLVATPRNGVWQQVTRTYHLLTISYGGTVSLIKDLTKEECEFAMNRALGRPATDAERAEQTARDKALAERVAKLCAKPNDETFIYSDGISASCKKDGTVGGYSYKGNSRSIGDGDIKSAECFE